jgi:hypothetical protein
LFGCRGNRPALKPEDQLKVKPHEKQIVEGSKVRMEFDIIEVLDYKPSKPSAVKGGS